MVKKLSLHSVPTTLPQQTVPESVKQTRDWKETTMNFFDYQSTMQTREKYDILKNYRIVSGDIDVRDYQFLKDPLNLGAEAKVKYGNTIDVTHYPIMIRPIQTILGEYIKRPTNFFVINDSSEAKNDYLRTKEELLKEWVMQQIQTKNLAKLKKAGIDPGTEEGQQQMQAMTPEEIEDYMNKGYNDVAEQSSQTILKNIWRREALDDTFLEGFKHAVISSREFYHTYRVNGKTKIRSLSPMDVYYHRSPSVKWISDAQYAGFRLYLTPSSIIDLYYDKLTANDIKDIEQLVGPYQGHMNKSEATGVDSIHYNTDTYSDFHGNMYTYYRDELQNLITDFQMHGNNSMYQNRIGLIKLVQSYWKSMRRIGFLTYYDEFDRPQQTIVSDDYEANKELGEYIKYQYINQVYQGTKIGDNIFLNIEPYTDYILDIDNLDDCPLPIEGCTYNDTNSKPVSPVDLMKPWNELYNIVAYELKKDINSSLGKVLFMSTDHIPNIPGFTWDKWYYWAKELKIAWVKQPARGANTFNQFSAADMSFADQMTAKMNILERIKVECDAIAGFSQPRIGASTEQTLGQSSQQIIASVNQTEYYFFKHYKLVERVLNYALNLARKSEKETGVLRNAFNDMEQRFVSEEGDQSNAKLRLFVTNSSADQLKREKLEQLLSLATSNGADITDVGEILLSQTISETMNIFKSLRKRNQKAEERKMQNEKEIQQMANDDAQLQRDWEKEKTEMTLESNEYRTYMQTFNRQPDNLRDSDASGTADVLEFDKFSFDRDTKSRDMLLKERKQYFDETVKTKELSQKDKELQIKEKVSNNAVKVARINPG